MSDRLSEIAEREKAATKGPWGMMLQLVSSDRNSAKVLQLDRLIGTPLVIPEWQTRKHYPVIADCGKRVEQDRFPHNRDATFIAHARQDIPWLITNTQQALALIRSVRDGNGWREIPMGVLNQIEAILLGNANETENNDGK